jgi:hypothetical protein
MQEVKTANISGKESKYLKDKINEFARNNKNKNISYLYRAVNEFKRGRPT